MVNAAVKERAVVADEYEALLPVQILRHLRAPLRVKVVCRLVYKQKAVPPEEQARKHKLCALAVAQCIKRAVQRARVHVKAVYFAQYLPFLGIGANGGYAVHCKRVRLRHIKGKIIEFHA